MGELMSLSEDDAEAFFADYATALVSRDPKRIAAFWGVPGLVLSDEGAIPIASSAEVEGFFGASMGQYPGIANVFARTRDVHVLSAGVLFCTVEWTHLDADGRAVGGETGHYVLRRGGEGVRIHVYTPRLG